MIIVQKIFSFLIALTLISLIGAWYLLKTTDLDQVMLNLDQELESLVHVPVHVQRPLKLTFFPRPSLQIQQIEIGSQTADSPYFIQLNDILLKLRLKPLLKKKLIFKEIQANQFLIQLHPSTPVSTPSEPITPNTHLLAIEKISLYNGRLESTVLSKPLILDHFQLSAQQLSFKDPIPVQAKAEIQYGSMPNPVLSTQVIFKGNLTVPSQSLTDPAKLLKYMEFNGQLHAEHFKMNAVEINTINAKLQSKSGSLLFNPMTLNLYKGEAFGDLVLDTSTGRTYLNQTATNMDGKLFFNLFHQNNPLSGNLDISLHTHFNLNLPDPIKSLTGNGNLSLKEGKIKNFNLAKLLELTRIKIHNLLNGLPADTSGNGMASNPFIYSGTTSFKLLSMQFHIQQSLLQSNSFVFQSEQLELSGEGYLSLATQEIHSTLNAHLDTGEGALNKIQQLMGGSFPLHLSGTLSQPEVIPDIQKITPYLQPLIVQKAIQSPARVIQKQLTDFFSPTTTTTNAD